MPKLSKKPGEKQARPVWDGPEAEGPQGGVTQGMLGRWLCCRERFRLRVIEGMSPVDQFNHRIEYGQMWHACEEKLAGKDSWEFALREHVKSLCQRYPMQQEQVVHWMNVCKTQFPLYVGYWSKHPDTRRVVHLLQEQVFDVPYTLPSGRVVRLRGKWDGIDLL